MTGTIAPVKGRVVACALAAIAAGTLLILALHWLNATGLRGEAFASQYAPMDGNAVVYVESPRERGGVLLLSGALARPGERVGEVRVYAALLPLDGEDEAMTLLNTQMVRRYDIAAELGCDDHCGFAAAARESALKPGRYAVVLADESNGEKRLAATGLTLALGDGGELLGFEIAEGGGA